MQPFPQIHDQILYCERGTPGVITQDPMDLCLTAMKFLKIESFVRLL